MFSKTFTAGALFASIAAAAPLASSEPTTHKFTLISSHSGDINVHLRPINAADGQFFLGRATSAYCPEGVAASACPENPNTSFVASDETSTLGLNTIVPGGQQVYIHPSGYLAFTQAHSAALPEGAITQGFEYTPPTQEGGTGSLTAPKPLTACPTGNSGEYQVKAVLEGLSYIGCTGIGAAAAEVTGPGAFQYA